MRRVLIFRNELLPRSETFILAQSLALRTFEVCFAAVHRAAVSLELPSEPMLVAASAGVWGKVRRWVFWRAGLAGGFYGVLKAMEPVLVHAHFALDGAAALPICARLGCPLVVTLHGYDVSSDDRSLARTEEGRVYLRRREELWRKASVFLCVSEFMRQRALEKGFPESKLRVLYTGTDLSIFRGECVERDRDLIVFTGRFVEKKGCRLLLDALEIVRREHPEVRLVMIGAGPLEGELKARVAAEGLPCEFLGMQPAAVVKEYLGRARVFCVPSVTAANGDSEGLGMVFVEAQAMGTPVVSFRHGGIPEVVRDGVTGLLADEGDVAGLAERLLQVLGDDEVWRRMSESGVAEMREAFDIVRQAARLERVYEDVIAGRLESLY